MIAAVVRIAPLDGRREHSEADLFTRLWSGAGADSRINHIRVRAGPAGFDILAFVVADGPSSAQSILRRVVLQCLTADPRLRLWRIV